LKALQLIEEARPGGAGLAADGAIGRIEFKNAIERCEIQKETILKKLLAAHGVTPARDRNRHLAGAGGFDDFGKLDEGFRAEDAFDGRSVQFRVEIVDDCLPSNSG
jgi:hypothetical protein